ncbi:hypothetical protein OFB62_31995, partial [Escherichia coli]|nr:hypothetical protein [Escherichia coli]
KAVLILFFLLAVGFHYQGFSQSVSRSQFVADQASLVSEFDVGGLKVILKRRPQSATVAGGLFIRGGARNIDAKNAGIERLML